MKTFSKEYLQNKLARIEKSIASNREQILKGGDRKYHSRQILSLNELASKTESAIEALNN